MQNLKVKKSQSRFLARPNKRKRKIYRVYRAILRNDISLSVSSDICCFRLCANKQKSTFLMYKYMKLNENDIIVTRAADTANFFWSEFTMQCHSLEQSSLFISTTDLKKKKKNYRRGEEGILRRKRKKSEERMGGKRKSCNIN